MRMLQRSCAAPYHEFWADDISLLDSKRFRADRIHGHRQLTDLYLLGLAVQHGARLVSFDTRIALAAVHGAAVRHLVALAS